ncbi:hypothetical protein PRVXT_000096 [Proteinivorax tanatarense]|uniref:Uncharacterized protein n=1 Tax=Proteinivorax tanatarense TaxID=1260629 RepID=A0AAU7VLS1_9FIRM
MFNKRLLMLCQEVDIATVESLQSMRKDILVQCVCLKSMSTVYIGQEKASWSKNKNILLLHGDTFNKSIFVKVKKLLDKVKRGHQTYPKNLWSIAYRGEKENPLKVALPFTKFEHIVKGFNKVEFGNSGVKDLCYYIPNVYTGEIIVH